MKIKVDSAGELLCGWFAACERTAAGLVAHPAFPDGVPTCEACAARFDLDLTPAEFQVTA